MTQEEKDRWENILCSALALPKKYLFPDTSSVDFINFILEHQKDAMKRVEDAEKKLLKLMGRDGKNKCDCGGEKSKSTHSDWCSTQKKQENEEIDWCTDLDWDLDCEDEEEDYTI